MQRHLGSRRNLTFCQKYRLLLWKDMKLQLGNRVELALIILLSALMPLLVAIGTRIAKSMFPADIVMEKAPGPKSVNMSFFEDIYFTPLNGVVDTIISNLALALNCKNTVGFDTLREMQVNMFKNQKAVGVAFPNDWFTIINYPDSLNFTIYTPTYIKRSSFKYFESGFLLIQEQVSRIFIDSKSGANITKVQMNHFPYPRYVPNHYAESANIMTYMMLVSFFYPCITIAKYIVAEKERQQKAILNTMGFKNSIHWLAWYTKSMVLLILCLLIIIIMFAIGAVYKFSNLICLILVLLVYIHSLVFFAFFVSSFCSKSFPAVLATLLLYVATGIPFAIVGTAKSSLSSQAAASLGLNSALFYILDSVATMELQSVGVQWYTMAKTASYGHKLSIVGYMMIMFAISWIELIICLYIEEVRPGEFGVPKSWYFPCQKQYWCPRRFVPSVFYEEPLLPISRPSSNRSFPFPNPSRSFWGNTNPQREVEIQKLPTNQQTGVDIKNLSKKFGYREVVKNLSFKMYENEITALLGHKGAGKTTTILMLCGMLPPTNGTAFINGHDITSDPNLAKTSLGICPQHSVLFRGLSVKDHIYFFSRVKGYSKIEARIESDLYVGKLDLVSYRKRDALKLSGSSQRRLSLACALCGGSKVILCDEPASGLDPRGRHDLWRLLQKEKHGRTVLLTTHLMEEGEILGDRIAIMSDGQLRCYGTLPFLKQSQNTCYTLSCVMSSIIKVDKLTEIINRYMNTVTPVIRGLEVTYKLPRSRADKFADMFRQLENNKKSFDVISFGLSDSVLDEIFLNLEANQEIRFKGGADPGDSDKVDFGTQTSLSTLRGPVPSEPEQMPESIIKTQDNKPKKKPKPEKKPEPEKKPDPEELQETQKPKPIERLRVMTRRKATCMSRWRAMMIKKAYYTASHVFIFLIILIIPLIYILIVIATGEKDSPISIIPTVFPLSLDYYNYEDIIILLEVKNNLYKDEEVAYKHSVSGAATVQKVSSVFSYLFEAPPLRRRDIRRKYVCGASFNDSSIITAWFNSDAFEHSAPIAMNLIYNTLGKIAIGHSFSISVSRGQLQDFVVTDKTKHRSKRQNGLDYEDYSDFETQENDGFIVDKGTTDNPSPDDDLRPPPHKPGLISQMPISESALVLFEERDKMYLFFGAIIAITAYLALALSIFTVFVTEERQNQVKLLREIHGLKRSDFWLTHFVWDLLIYSIFMAALTLALYKAAMWYQVLIILLLIGFACLPFVYLCSLLFKKPCTAFSMNFTILVITGGILFCGLFLTRSNSLRATFIIFPMYVGAFGLFKCLSWREYCEREILPPIDDLECNFGSCNVFCACKPENNWIEVWLLVVHGLIWFFLLWISSLGHVILNKLTSTKSNRDWNYFDKDNKVLDEEKRVAQIPNYEYEEYSIIVDQVKKNYCRTKAVKCVSFAIKPGECFGLLGSHEAGKSSIYRMIVGETRISAGNIYVRGNSLREHRNAAKKEIGYCPQSDTLHGFLTGRQTLKIYCLLMGVPKNEIKMVSEQLAIDFGFSNQLDEKISTYSGGTKRKLNVALAVNSGTVICLDEANSGIDPTTRHFLCHKIESVSKGGRAVLLTTNNMEVVNATCSRVGFLVAGEMSCMGSMQQVRSEVSNINVIKIKVNTKQEEEKKVMRKFKSEMAKIFPMAKLQETLENYLRYHINKNATTLSNLFYQMELKRSEGKLEDYSITQASLKEIYMELNDEDFAVLVDSDSESSEVSHEDEATFTINKKPSSKYILDKDKFKEKKSERKKKKEKEIKKRPATSSSSTDSDEPVSDNSKKPRKWF
ncbi:hypothetical protein KR084_010384 [Drosophila pseudotakahashii]|nr:hypothetical protein KR084_010384 [Drosophila pseudotakahashii]